MSTLKERLESFRVYRNELVRQLRAFKQDLGLCIETHCKQEANDGVRCEECAEKARDVVAAAQQKKARSRKAKRKAKADIRVEHAFDDSTGFDACGKCGLPRRLHRVRRR